MSFQHEVIESLPISAPKDAELLRALLTLRYAYCLADDESAEDFTAVDPDDGTLPLYLIQGGSLFKLDPDDTTTAHDGVTCLVTADDKRYKSEVIDYPWSVLDKDTTAQPGSPTVGDRYLIPTAATGTDWAGEDDKVGIYTAAGWRFAVVPVGRLLYVEDETAFYHRNDAGVWTAGIGSIALSANTVARSRIIGTGLRTQVAVEDQTTNAPPGSAAVGVAYVIGSVPTGAWSGHPGKVAICEATDTFTIYTPVDGDVVYDKTLKIEYRWNATASAWQSAAGAWIGFKTSGFTDGTGSTTLSSGAGGYDFSLTPPTSSRARKSDDACALAYTAKSTTSKLRIRYTVDILEWYTDTASIGNVTNSNTVGLTFALFRDNESNAIKHRYLGPTDAGPIGALVLEFDVSVPDTSAHTYKPVFIAAFIQDGTTDHLRYPTIAHREMTIEEVTP